ncbi:SseB family protein [Jonesia quinghaiensis]|uniref:SseB family protein n=1 Tax=Jonesia quinghaiensis TaxID=262806 RepID=UPI00041F1C5E|nr:SseB family protein [Jonesia quinghaiensis]
MTGRELPPGSSFSGDDGSADPVLLEALRSAREDDDNIVGVVAALSSTRVLIPILASLDAEGFTEDGHKFDKEASAGVVALEAPDGRRALPVFTSVEAMSRWRSDARPVPVEARRAALSAVSEDWALLIIDPGSDHQCQIPRTAVWAIAQGKQWEPAVRDGRVAGDIEGEIQRLVAPLDHVLGARALPGNTAEVAVALIIDSGLAQAGLRYVLGTVNTALASSEIIAHRVDSLELRVSAGHQR